MKYRAQFLTFGENQISMSTADEDRAVNWNNYFTEKHFGTKSGTSSFRSSELLNPASTNHIHSPIDDYYSLYFLTQWAFAFHHLIPEDKPKEPQHLQQLRSRLAGNVIRRDAATYTITDVLNMDADQYRAFLSQAQQFLRDWSRSFTWINEWNNLKKSQVFDATFHNIAD
ncbi:hypothetical protein GGU11DRAFT_797220 [Lentinula aff. detonsa]|nr:hypothetical protein GGU11DRAFT_797220 [Lentinula aff. detonsa]